MEFENTRVFNFDGALRGMRNPMESWDKSDSLFSDIYTVAGKSLEELRLIEIGENDLALAQRLIRLGSDQRKFMRQIFICVDITAPLYWWKEFDTYKVGTVSDSTSTMHKLTSKPITEQSFEIDLGTLSKDKNCNVGEIWGDTITKLETLRQSYVETKDKKTWRSLIQLLPESWLQTRTVTMNYENALAIAHSDRKNHKLTEWSKSFFDWLHTLPYAEELIFLDITPAYIKSAIERLLDLSDLLSKNLADNVMVAEALENIAHQLGGK